MGSQFGALLGLIVLAAALTAANPRFAGIENLNSILKQASYVGITAAGQTLVIVTGGIDLAVGSVVALAGVLTAGLMTGFSLDAAGSGMIIAAPLAILAGLLAGLAAGAFNGFLVARVRMPPFIVTLASMLIVRGLAMVYTNGQNIGGLPDEWFWLSGEVVLPFGMELPVSGLFMLGVFAVLAVVASRTMFGRNMYAVGGNEEAARLSGVDVARVKIAVYSISGALSALAGVLLIFRTRSGLWNAGDMYELDAIAACVIGGTSLSGGTGTVGGTLIGVLIMGCVRSGMTLLNVSPYWQKVAIGAIILLAVGIDMLRRKVRSAGS